MDNMSSDNIKRATEEAKVAEPFVVQELRKKAELFLERHKLYGNNYHRFGHVMALVLAGQTLRPSDADEMNRLGLLVHIITKLTRYGDNFNRGGHDDSLDDLSVYAMMAKEVDCEIRARKTREALSKSPFTKAEPFDETLNKSPFALTHNETEPFKDEDYSGAEVVAASEEKLKKG